MFRNYWSESFERLAIAEWLPLGWMAEPTRLLEPAVRFVARDDVVKTTLIHGRQRLAKIDARNAIVEVRVAGDEDLPL